VVVLFGLPRENSGCCLPTDRTGPRSSCAPDRTCVPYDRTSSKTLLVVAFSHSIFAAIHDEWFLSRQIRRDLDFVDEPYLSFRWLRAGPAENIHVWIDVRTRTTTTMIIMTIKYCFTPNASTIPNTLLKQ
jgi:hypothetical protein